MSFCQNVINLIEAKQNAGKYARLVEFLDNKISQLESEIENAENALNAVDTNFKAYDDSAEGLLKDTFDFKENAVWKSKYLEIIQNMRQGLCSLRMKKMSASQLATYWEQRVNIEEIKLYAEF